jgi:hypothetical protein
LIVRCGGRSTQSKDPQLPFLTSEWATTHRLRNAVSSVAMIKTIALWVYRGLYCAFLGVVILGLLLRLPFGESLRPFEHPLCLAFFGSIAFAIFSAIAFSRIPERLIWCATLLLQQCSSGMDGFRRVPHSCCTSCTLLILRKPQRKSVHLGMARWLGPRAC